MVLLFGFSLILVLVSLLFASGLDNAWLLLGIPAGLVLFMVAVVGLKSGRDKERSDFINAYQCKPVFVHEGASLKLLPTNTSGELQLVGHVGECVLCNDKVVHCL